MKKIISLNSCLIVCMLIFFNSCKDIYGIYLVNGNKMSRLTINKDSFYIFNNELSSGTGYWMINQDTLTLNSKWKECCIDSIQIQRSISNTNDSTFISFRLFDGDYPYWSFLRLIASKDTVIHLIFGKDTLSTSKKNYESMQILVPVSTKKWAEGPVMRFEKSDSLLITYKYVNNTQGYPFFDNEKFLIKKKKKIIIPLARL